MSFFLKLSLAANLGLGGYAYWVHQNSYGEARKWLQYEVQKVEASQLNGGSSQKNCLSVWKIAFDLRGVQEVPLIPTAPDSAMASSDSATHSPEHKTAESHPSAHGDTDLTEHHAKDSDAPDPHSPPTAKTADQHGSNSKSPWIPYLKERIQQEKLWDAQLSLKQESPSRLMIQGGSCTLGIVVSGPRLISLDISGMRKASD